MTNLNSYYDELDLNFDPAFASARRSLNGLVRILIGAAVLTGVALISTTAINNYNESTHLSAVGAAPVIRTDAGADKQNVNFLARLEALLNYAQVLSRSAPRQVDEPVESPFRLSGAPTYPAVSGIEQGLIVSAEPSPAATPAPIFSYPGIVATPRQKPIRQTVNTAPPPKAAAATPPADAWVPSSPSLISPAELATSAPVPTRATRPTEEQTALAGATAWRIQLISLSNQENAKAVSARLAQANQDLLDGLTLHVQQARLSKGTFYRVQAGPLADRATAASLCNSLKSRNQDCLIVAP